jgi:lipid-binding SYLF domain-containing protein
MSLLAVVAMAVAGCESTSGNSQSENATLSTRAHAALDQMANSNESVRDAMQNAYAYVIFPEVGKAAVGIGGAGGKGVVYQGGHQVGYATLNQGSLGPQIGGETYSELILFQNQSSFSNFQSGNLTFGADASATVVKAGAAAAGQFVNGTRVLILPKGGLMAGASINGQKFTYTAGAASDER